ncbi:hypothetical protein ABMA10_13440 [Plantibacter sp. RU18]
MIFGAFPTRHHAIEAAAFVVVSGPRPVAVVSRHVTSLCTALTTGVVARSVATQYQPALSECAQAPQGVL